MLTGEPDLYIDSVIAEVARAQAAEMLAAHAVVPGAVPVFDVGAT